MRKILPIGLLLTLGMACTLPSKHDPNLLKSGILGIPEEVPTGPTSEGSLWEGRSLFADPRAAHLNDLVTIQISESTNAITQANTTTSKKGNNAMTAPVLMSRIQNTSSASDFQGNGTTGRSATFRTTVTARVVKVLNNGNLIFEGSRQISLNNETQRLYVAGLIDPRRLSKDNTIQSGLVSDLHIAYGGAGIVDEQLKPGVISRILNYVWPF
ncbi:MAG: flagellar basal body L-ring protein FlgH [Holophagales bacterium]|jgi:flagellar L-ring protein precursor FlgH|nr:flagellar basal body L-ring protein FlgH [Holophagales bacterium]